MATRKQEKRSLRNEELIKAKLEGDSYAELAQKFNLSRQRIQQILSPPPEIRRYIINKYNGQCKVCGAYTGTSGHVHHKQLEKNGGNYQDIDNLELLCKSCHRKRHHIPLKTISLLCSCCGKKYERYLNSETRWALRKNKSGLHFCSKACQGKWLATNHGFKKGDNRLRGSGRKYDYNLVCCLKKDGLSGIQISRRLDIPEATVYKILLLSISKNS